MLFTVPLEHLETLSRQGLTALWSTLQNYLDAETPQYSCILGRSVLSQEYIEEIDMLIDQGFYPVPLNSTECHTIEVLEASTDSRFIELDQLPKHIAEYILYHRAFVHRWSIR